jgi:type IV pilus assembly protein PilE
MKHTQQNGMSLIELLTVVMVVGVLSALAVSSYTSYTLRANRTDATTTLLRIQVAEEKFFLSNNTYTTDFITAPPTGLGISNVATTNNGRYTIAIAAGATGAIATSYSATATAIGAQTSDKAVCLTYGITDQGIRSPADSSGCWK